MTNNNFLLMTETRPRKDSIRMLFVITCQNEGYYLFHILCFYLLDNFCWYTANNGIRFYIFSYYGTCCNNSSIADGHTCQYCGIGSNPDVLADVDGCIAHTLTLGWIKVVVDGRQHDIVADECTIVNSDTTLVLELAAHVDEYSLTNDGVLTAVGMEWREHAYRLRHLTPPKLLQQGVQFLWCMILAVDLGCNLQCLLRQLMKHPMDFTAPNDGLARCHVISKFLYGHVFLFGKGIILFIADRFEPLMAFLLIADKYNVREMLELLLKKNGQTHRKIMAYSKARNVYKECVLEEFALQPLAYRLIVEFQ